MSICQKTEDGYKILASSNGNVINGAELEHYSNEERIVGYWTDGKPIYRKVVTFTATQKGTQKQVSLSTLGITNVDKMVRQQGLINTSPIPKYYGATDGWNVNFGVDTSVISYIVGEYWTVPIQMTACLEYTKTTDTPITNNNTYSTDEVITGKTWIDGKPIYRKVVSGNQISVGYKLITDSLNINDNTIIDCRGSVYNSAGTNLWAIPLFGAEDNVSFVLQSDGLKFYSTTAWGGAWKVIIEYTKTTD